MSLANMALQCWRRSQDGHDRRAPVRQRSRRWCPGHSVAHTACRRPAQGARGASAVPSSAGNSPLAGLAGQGRPTAHAIASRGRSSSRSLAGTTRFECRPITDPTTERTSPQGTHRAGAPLWPSARTMAGHCRRNEAARRSVRASIAFVCAHQEGCRCCNHG